MPKDAKRFQQAAGRLTNNPKLADVLEELERDPQARKQAKGDPKGFLKKKGLDIPDDMTVTMGEGSWWFEFCIFGFCVRIYSQ